MGDIMSTGVRGIVCAVALIISQVTIRPAFATEEIPTESDNATALHMAVDPTSSIGNRGNAVDPRAIYALEVTCEGEGVLPTVRRRIL
jgi:hypothetical protein